MGPGVVVGGGVREGYLGGGRRGIWGREEVYAGSTRRHARLASHAQCLTLSLYAGRSSMSVFTLRPACPTALLIHLAKPCPMWWRGLSPASPYTVLPWRLIVWSMTDLKLKDRFELLGAAATASAAASGSAACPASSAASDASASGQSAALCGCPADSSS